MRTCFIVILAGIMLVSIPAVAGTVTATDGKVGWQSTQCPPPAAPASLVSADHETPAEDMNTRITQYNQYVGLMQTYMQCMSKEAEGDANMASGAVIKAGQGVIEEVKSSLDKLGAPLMAK
jgi:hypothetical protein